MNINWSEASTKRGVVWIVASILGTIMVFMGKDPSQILVLATGVAGGLGLLPDKSE